MKVALIKKMWMMMVVVLQKVNDEGSCMTEGWMVKVVV